MSALILILFVLLLVFISYCLLLSIDMKDMEKRLKKAEDLLNECRCQMATLADLAVALTEEMEKKEDKVPYDPDWCEK